MTSTQTTTVTEAKTLVITLAVGGALAIASAFIFGWHSIDQKRQLQTSPMVTSLVPTIVEISRH